MKNLRFGLAMMVVLLMAGSVQAEKFVSASHIMKINGTSTLHDWEAPAQTLNANGDITVTNGTLQTITSLSVTCQSKSIKSPKGESMDEKIYDALKADDFPNINFTLVKVKSITKTAEGWTVETSGNLTIAGETRMVDMTVKAILKPTGEIAFSGTKAIKLSQFNIERPSAMLGVIKCGDDITLTFDLTMRKG